MESNGAVARQHIFKPRSCKLLTLAQIDIDSNWANIHRADGKIRRSLPAGDRGEKCCWPNGHSISQTELTGCMHSQGKL